MNEGIGVLIAVLSSSFGGMAGAVTRFVVGTIDPVTLAAFRFGIGFLLLLLLVLLLRSELPRGRDWLGVTLLGIMFFAVFFVFYNIALAYTTAARGALALSTLPLWTMVVAALLGAEALTARKTLGVLIAVGGVALALLAVLRRRRKAHGAATSSWSARRCAWRSITSGRGRSSRAPRRSGSSPRRWARARSASSRSRG